MGAVFKLTSASASTGIEELFKTIGRKFLDPNFEEEDNAAFAARNESIKLDTTKAKEVAQKKKCC